MTPATPPPTPDAPLFQLALAGVLAALGFYYLLPRPTGRLPLWGSALAVGGLVAFVTFVLGAFGPPTPDPVGRALFWLFAVGAVAAGTVLVTQPNPARGALAFAFVVLSVCGLFLLLAAPFLMAATVIVYAGAIVVTFLFVLMLSHADGPSDENDRSRDPLLGALAGFGFAGLVLFGLHEGKAHGRPLPAPPLVPAEKAALADAAGQLRAALAAESAADVLAATKATRDTIAGVVGSADGGPAVGPPLQQRLRVAAADARVADVIRRADDLKAANRAVLDGVENNLLNARPDVAGAKKELRGLLDRVLLVGSAGELPARNVGTVGLALYSEHLAAVELAGTLLLVATIGAVAIAGRTYRVTGAA